GSGLSTEVSLAVPPGSLGFWSARLQHYRVPLANAEVRFGEHVLPMRDPHGLRVALVESASALERPFTPWDGGPVAGEHQIRGLESARMSEASLPITTSFLESAMGFQLIGTEGEWHRYGVAGGRSGCYVDVREVPGARRGAWGTGSIHHLAWRVDDEAHQAEVRTSVSSGGAHPTPLIDRFWFKSVYFKEPGGVLFELATDGPGFAVDEDPAHLGETLVLPPWLEPQRTDIEAVLPKLAMPSPPAA
ncbi:MAG TPA: ring-cleaving dioxygenase, partial [Chthoniobacterales bacterium]